MSKIKLDLNSEQNILNMLMENSSLSEDQMSKINANSKEIGKTKLGEFLLFLGYFHRKYVQIMGFKAPGNYSDQFWSNKISVLLC